MVICSTWPHTPNKVATKGAVVTREMGEVASSNVIFLPLFHTQLAVRNVLWVPKMCFGREYILLGSFFSGSKNFRINTHKTFFNGQIKALSWYWSWEECPILLAHAEHDGHTRFQKSPIYGVAPCQMSMILIHTRTLTSRHFIWQLSAPLFQNGDSFINTCCAIDIRQ